MSDEINNRLQRIEDKIDKLDTRLDDNTVILAKQSQILDEHQRRSVALEKQVELFEEDFDTRLAPIQKHVGQVNTILSFLKSFFGYLGAFVVFLATAIGLFQALRNLF